MFKRKDRNKGIKHNPVVAKTVMPGKKYNFNEVFENAKRERDKSYKRVDR